MILFTGRGVLTFEGRDELDDVPYHIEIGFRDGFRRGQLFLDAHLVKLLVAHQIVLTLTLQDGRTLVCQMTNAAGEVIKLAGGTL